MKSHTYRERLAEHSAIWGDQYALTMSQAFFNNDKHNINTTFHLFIRKNPFDGAYLLTAGQNILFEWLDKHWRFDDEDLEILRSETIIDPRTGDEKRLYTDEFIDMVADASLELTIDAMPEGELAFPEEPIIRVHGPLWQCLMIEGAALNIINSQSLFATLSSRLSEVADGGPVLEFGLRRAQAIGGLEPSRAAYIGGVAGTSNNLARKYYGIPSVGTFAHALVMVYEDEVQAFKEYAQAMPYNGIFLVDTYDTIEGVKRAAQVCTELDVPLKGIRLDSGDLAYLSKECRKILDDMGFPDAKIAASNDLDEETVQSLKHQGAKIDLWGIGTNLVTAKQQPALGAVYKVGAVFDKGLTQQEIDATRTLIKRGQDPNGQGFVRDVIKLSEQIGKISIPGEMDILRYLFEEAGLPVRYDGDTIISNIVKDPVRTGVHPGQDYPDVLDRDIVSVRKDDDSLRKRFNKGTSVYRPLIPVFRQGRLVTDIETVHQARERGARSLSRLHPTHKRLKNPHRYIVGLEESLHEKRKQMIHDLRQG